MVPTLATLMSMGKPARSSLNIVLLNLSSNSGRTYHIPNFATRCELLLHVPSRNDDQHVAMQITEQT